VATERCGPSRCGQSLARTLAAQGTARPTQRPDLARHPDAGFARLTIFVLILVSIVVEGPPATLRMAMRACRDNYRDEDDGGTTTIKTKIATRI
jgi:hypothetical protein